ncbi:AAA family ATPase [Candidatus Bathyarchaeota archaeon]|nr:AAA family ATPase [Candidatus Bathyarchaeota archaeon]
MLFDPSPKISKRDFYDRESELEKFRDSIEYTSLVVIQGLRRSGKTSFMNVALRESNLPYIILDMRGLPFNPSQSDLLRRTEAAFNQLEEKWISQLQSALMRIKGVSILGSSISLDWSREGVDLSTLFDRINSWAEEKNTKFLLAFDEIQLIRGEKSIIRLLAHIIDYNQNICLIVTGSEIGLLFDFLGMEDPESPLYGRHYTEIKMSNFDELQSREFLQTGFREIGIDPPEDIINYAISKLNGTVGWLTLFGVKCSEEKKASKDLVDAVVSDGGKLARSEANKVARYSRRYSIILNHLSTTGKSSWTQIKTILEIRERKTLTNAAVSDLLNRLVKASLLEKNATYSISDPLLREGLLDNPLPEK